MTATTPLTAEREQQIRTLDLAPLMDDRPAAVVSGHLAALLGEIDRLRARTLTPGEYNAAWHAVEGSAGEEGADPGTVLHAVLDRLGIAWQDAAVPAAVETGE
ncbi:MAG: hypothetical protein HOY69_18950 [Streptomyces sp.]|nr:hypothetical protein [Streptomyces sp.]